MSGLIHDLISIRVVSQKVQCVDSHLLLVEYHQQTKKTVEAFPKRVVKKVD